jgi:hypothetical protein
MVEISIAEGDRHCPRTIGLTLALDRPDGLRGWGEWLQNHFFESLSGRFFMKIENE